MAIKQPVILNSRGEPIVLTTQEKYRSELLQRRFNEEFRHTLPSLQNSLGYEVSITTLTAISKQVSEQKFFEVAPADYLPVRVGEGTWNTNLTAFRSFDIGGDFETGILNTGGQNARLASADVGVDAVNIKLYPWGKELGWSIFDLEFAAMSGNWDLVQSKERSRKKNWDLGIQRVAFLGARGMTGTTGTCNGLLTLPGVTTNTTRITKPISQMTTSELKAFTAGVVDDYRANCNRTAWLTHFIIPESDYLGLGSQASPDFPIKSTLQLLNDMFKEIVPNGKFKGILPLSYCDKAYNTLGVQCYVSLNHNEESLVMNIPLDYTNTLANSLNNFQFLNVGYGQFSGVLLKRPLEVLYYQY